MNDVRQSGMANLAIRIALFLVSRFEGGVARVVERALKSGLAGPEGIARAIRRAAPVAVVVVGQRDVRTVRPL
jgi:hypothetical protein